MAMDIKLLIAIIFTFLLLSSAKHSTGNQNSDKDAQIFSPDVHINSKTLPSNLNQHNPLDEVKDELTKETFEELNGGIISTDENSEGEWIDFDKDSVREIREPLRAESNLRGNHAFRRVKRQWIIPGTNWCGVGNVSRDNQSTGDLASVDRCCRAHDTCPYTITGFTTKYNLYNFRFHTISHCECDDIFRTCLKMSSHDQADTVGELFFNMLGMKCFVFRKDQVCAERNWWGRCERHKYQWSAETRDAIPY